jgi:hypothetical protein
MPWPMTVSFGSSFLHSAGSSLTLRHQRRWVQSWQYVMLDKVHEMRMLIMTSPSFDGDRIIGAFLFNYTMKQSIKGIPTADYLLEGEGGRVIPEGPQGSQFREGWGPANEAHCRPWQFLQIGDRPQWIRDQDEERDQSRESLGNQEGRWNRAFCSAVKITWLLWPHPHTLFNVLCSWRHVNRLFNSVVVAKLSEVQTSLPITLRQASKSRKKSRKLHRYSVLNLQLDEASVTVVINYTMSVWVAFAILLTYSCSTLITLPWVQQWRSDTFSPVIVLSWKRARIT